MGAWQYGGMRTVHVILNAHIDPIWLWPWQAGLDAALATCRSVCDLLDRHHDVHFTRGEAWIYRQIERTDSDLFQRIRDHVEGGRWQIVGGWWIQPDCNLPSGFAIERQIALGKKYFLDRFGFFPRVAYNVDSFGHAASLPGYMSAAGQKFYVMMRPQEWEMSLPARVFRWRGYEGGPEVVAFRIAQSYCHRLCRQECIEEALRDLPEGVDHTMLFVGVGDHGGGPTERQISWIQEHQDAFEGVRLIFSWPQKFFDAISAHLDRLPLVTGELQYHAIGAYSVHRAVKTRVRKAEHLLIQAECASTLDPKASPDQPKRIEEAWEHVCFNHFHDTLGGSCIPSAYDQVDAQLGFAQTVADEAIQMSLRRQIVKLPDDPLQRIVLFNCSDQPFEGYTEFEPWVFGNWEPDWRLLDEGGVQTPCQAMESEGTLVGGPTRVLFRTSISPYQIRTLRIDASGDKRQSKSPETECLVRGIDSIENGAGIRVRLDGGNGLFFGKAYLPMPRLELLEDFSDTWSHGIGRYAEGPAQSAQWQAPFSEDSGPLMTSLLMDGAIGSSMLRSEFRVYAGEHFIEWRIRVHWVDSHRLLKIVFGLPAPVANRVDGIPGGELQRTADGQEYPIRDWTLLSLESGLKVGVVCPDVYAMDVLPHRFRLTLLRSPCMAYDAPYGQVPARAAISDQGVHEFRFRLFCGNDVTSLQLDRQATMYHRPLIGADLTRGMPCHCGRAEQAR